MRRALLQLVFAVVVATVGSDALADPPPSVERAICRPTFLVEARTLDAGTAFVLDWDGSDPRTILVSAHHLFGPDGGLAAQIPASAVAEKVTAVKCAALATREVWRAGRALTMPAAQSIEIDSRNLRDLSAFTFESAAQESHPSHLKLAKRAPNVGDSVWLLAQAVRGAPPNQLLHHGTVTYSNDSGLQYRLDNAGLVLRATSGAPVLDDDGNVVGVHVGHVLSKGPAAAVADSIDNVRALLETAR